MHQHHLAAPLIFLRQGSSLAWSSLTGLHWLATEPRESVFPLSQHWEGKHTPAYLDPYVCAEDHIQALRLSEEALYWMSNCPTGESESTLLFLLQDKLINFESLVLICILWRLPALSSPCSQFSLRCNLFIIFLGIFLKQLSFTTRYPVRKSNAC